MKGKMNLYFRTILISVGILLSLWAVGSSLLRENSVAFGGGFAPMAQQQMGRYQIAGRDGNSAWVIDTAVGDIYMVYANGKWKDVGSILDEKNRIKN